MHFLIQAFKHFLRLWSALTEARRLVKINRDLPYRIIEVNTTNCSLSLHCCGTQAVIKISFAEALADPTIVTGLPSLQACWLGYYYARFQQSNHSKRNRDGGMLGFTPQHKKGRFKIVGFQHRTGVLIYYDVKLNRTYEEKITDVAQDKFVINNIDPTLACHIGMQAGYEVSRHSIDILKKKLAPPTLKLVK